MLSAPAVAQDVDTTGAAASDGGDIIFVTGSRIARPETDNAAPVVSITAQNIEQSGLTNITELLTQTPSLFNSEDNFDAAGSQARFGGAGVNLLNLRNLGAKRTLVLVDGRRHVAGAPGEAAVDINTIPTALVERIDVLTGGVSPIYGADGVSGVVNFVMKDDFEGLDFRAQQGISDFGDAESTFVSATVGRQVHGGRGNIALSYEFRRDERVAFGDRPNGRFDALLLVRNPDDQPDDPNIPDNIPLPFIGWADSAPGGALVIDSSFAAVFRGDGQVYNPGTSLPGSGFRSAGTANTDDTPVASYQGDLQAQTEHHSLNFFSHYDVTPTVRFFAEGKYVDTQTFTISQPSFDFFTFVSNDNPLIPQNVRDAVDAIAAIDAANAGDDDYEPIGFGGVLFNRDNFDLGTRGEFVDREVFRTVFGIDGDLTDNAQFELSYTFGQNNTKYTSLNYRIADRYFAALDAVDEGQFLNGTPNGNIVCRVSIDGSGIVDSGNFSYGEAPQTFAPQDCVPLNVFGEGVASQASLDFINADLQNRFTITQYVVNGFVTGDFGHLFELPGGAIGYAFGAEYREERSKSLFDPISKQVADFDPDTGVMADLALLADERGAFNVYEAFGEINIPLLADMPLAHLLEVSASARVSDYSISGYADSWAVSGIYAPIEDVRFRGSYSKSTRAPNITELFAPRTGTFSFIEDPCDPNNIDNGTEFRVANCRALIEGLGADFDDYDYESEIDSSASLPGFNSGNTNLAQERATTWTAGVVVSPSFIPNLYLSFDWFDIELNEAINTTSLTRLAEFCVDSPNLDNVFCPLVDRAQGTGYVESFQLAPVNVAFFETSGADFTVNYSTRLGAGSALSFRGTVGYLDKLNFLPANGGTVNDDRGESGAPKWNGNADLTWSNDNWSINYGLQYIGRQSRYANDVIAGNPDIAAPEYIYFNERFIHDARIQYNTAGERFGVYAGVNNFTNELPPLGSINAPTGWLGRYFYAGLRIRTDALSF
nr:TonB-dependent receptor [Altererythrobacter sp. KTW20L]